MMWWCSATWGCRLQVGDTAQHGDADCDVVMLHKLVVHAPIVIINQVMLPGTHLWYRFPTGAKCMVCAPHALHPRTWDWQGHCHWRPHVSHSTTRKRLRFSFTYLFLGNVVTHYLIRIYSECWLKTVHLWNLFVCYMKSMSHLLVILFNPMLKLASTCLSMYSSVNCFHL